MYGRTEVKAFSIFRTFLNGTKGSPMFPNGLIYEGIIIGTLIIIYLSIYHILIIITRI